MRTHEQIIIDAGGPAAVSKLVPAAAGTVKQWRRTNSIPAPYWRSIADHGLASLEELADAASARLAANDDDLKANAA